MGEACCAGKAKSADMAGPAATMDKVRLYRPLIVITIASLLGAAALAKAGLLYMNGAMGLFLLFIASLQMFDINGFARMFARYDIIAARYFTYGQAYPMILFALGLFYLWGGLPVFTNGVTLIIMLVSALGVFDAIRKGHQVECACIGAGFTLPVGKVTLAEDLIMAIMALINLQMALAA